MSGSVLIIDEVLRPDYEAWNIANKWTRWDSLRHDWKQFTEETRRFIYATDTTQTSVVKVPWHNKTTVPKLCQIRDNLYANYMITLFPKSKWVFWEAGTPQDALGQKKTTIEAYMQWVLSQPHFKREMEKLVMDYIDYGNCFAITEWVDERIQLEDKTQVGYVGPAIRRISPLDIVFNPIAESFEKTPKIIRSLISLGELKKKLDNMTTPDNKETIKGLYDYLVEIRSQVSKYTGEIQQKDNLYNVDGFSSFQNYLESDYVEVLTFYGDMFNRETNELQENRIITVVDRHKVINNVPNPSFFGYPKIRHIGWRRRQDNLWAMGPLDNLVGMQYRMDHLENLKADVWDLTAYPVKKIKGSGVEEFEWEPNADIYMDTDSDVELYTPEVMALQANTDIAYLQQMMEEMAGAPREAMGFRSPGEKTAYEVQRLENAASRIYQNKIKQFEEHFEEKLLNDMLEEASRNVTSTITIGVLDNEFQIQTFQDLTVTDITGVGKVRPMAARHFAEQAELVQNMTQLSSSPLWQIVQPHTSGIAVTKMFEQIFNVEDFGIFAPFIGISEQSEAQKFANISQEQALTSAATPSGLTNADYTTNEPQVAQTPVAGPS